MPTGRGSPLRLSQRVCRISKFEKEPSTLLTVTAAAACDTTMIGFGSKPTISTFSQLRITAISVTNPPRTTIFRTSWDEEEEAFAETAKSIASCNVGNRGHGTCKIVESFGACGISEDIAAVGFDGGLAAGGFGARTASCCFVWFVTSFRALFVMLLLIDPEKRVDCA